MTTINEVEKQIAAVEGFDARLRHEYSGRAVRRDRSNLADYPAWRRTFGVESVDQFNLFNAYRDVGLRIEVLNHDGSVASGGTALSSVRMSYKPSPPSDRPESDANLLRYYLDYSGGIDLALREYMIEVLRRRGVAAPTGEDFGKLFGLGYSKSVQFQFVTEDDVQMEADAIIGCPDELPKRFWARFEMVIHRCVMVIHSGTRSHSVDFGVLTDGIRDWWYAFANTNYYIGYETGRSTPATIKERKRQLLSYVSQAGDFITDPGHFTTSLTGDDLKWLREAQELQVIYEAGTLRRL